MSGTLLSVSRKLSSVGGGRSGRRVVITGIGIVCPLGVGTKSAWDSLIAGKCGLKKLEEADYEKLPCRIGKSVRAAKMEKKFKKF